MAEQSKAKTKVVIHQRIYRNGELAEWIEGRFGSKQEQGAAWETAFRIAEMYPEVSDKIRGELIDEDVQEEI